MTTLTAGADLPDSEHPTMIFLGSIGIAVVSAPSLSWDQRVEYARLFAAAPRMLAALEFIVDRWGTYDFPSVHDAALIEDAREAVQLAKGKK